jgi:hypothetical protein
MMEEAAVAGLDLVEALEWVGLRPAADQAAVVRHPADPVEALAAVVVAARPGASADLEAAVEVRHRIVTIWLPIGDDRIMTSAIGWLGIFW